MASFFKFINTFIKKNLYVAKDKLVEIYNKNAPQVNESQHTNTKKQVMNYTDFKHALARLGHHVNQQKIKLLLNQ